MFLDYIIILPAIIIAYFIGSISSAILVCKLMHLPDPRTQGSQNPGATNVLRIGGKKAAALTLLGDVLKGTIPVFICKWLGLPDAVLASVALAAFIGHLFPVFFKFQGGKGIATLFGCLIALNSLVALCWSVTWLIVALITRYSSLASLIASLLTPLYFWLLTGNKIYVFVTLMMALISIYRHKLNIIRLWSGTESRIRIRR